MKAAIGARRATARVIQVAAFPLLLLLISSAACAAMLPSPRQLGQDAGFVTPGASSPSSEATSQGLLGQLWSALFAANKSPGADLDHTRARARVADGHGRVSGAHLLQYSTAYHLHAMHHGGMRATRHAG